MGRKEALLKVIETGRAAGEALISRASPADRDTIGTFEIWSTKDAICHVAEWLANDLRKLDITERPLPSIVADTIKHANSEIFDKHATKSWDEVVSFFRSTFDDARQKIERITEDEVNAQYEHSDGSSRAVWRMIGGHALMHLAQHFALVYRRIATDDEATQLEERAASVLKGLDDSPEWQGTAIYNLACNYSLIGNATRAFELLREALKLNPDLVKWCENDEDLEPIRNMPEYKELLE